MKTIKIGMMPGQINEFAVEENATIFNALAVAGLEHEGYDVKVDSNTVSDLNTPVGNASYILLVKQVKGNK